MFRRLLLSQWPSWEHKDSDSDIVEARIKELEGQTHRGLKVLLSDHAGPGHVPAPNHPWAWDRIVDVFQGVDVREHLEGSAVNPVTEEPSDPELDLLREVLNTPAAEEEVIRKTALLPVNTALELKEW